MQNLSDNELDKHFQEAAEKYRPPFDPEAWQRMQARLAKSGGDGSSAAGGFYRSVPFILIFLAGSVTGILTWSYFSEKDFQSQNEQTDDVSLNSSNEEGTHPPATSKAVDGQYFAEGLIDDSGEANNPKPSSRTQPPIAEPQNHNDYEDRDQSLIDASDKLNAAIKPAGSTVQRSIQNKTVTPPDTQQSGITTSSATTNTTAMASGSYTPEPGRRTSQDAPIPMVSDGINDPGAPAKNTTNEDNITIGKQSENRPVRNVMITGGADSASVETNSPTQFPNAAGQDDETRNSDQRRSHYRLSLIAAISPDFSSVNFGQQTKPGSNYGALLEFHVSPRISVVSGLISSTKLYKARNIEYYGHPVSEAEGDCRIIDIPVNVYFRSGGASRYSWFGGAGLSSYLMKKENYVFYYDTPYGKTSYDKEVRNENNEWFRILNVSAGVSRRFNPQFAIEIEPFVKIPLSGIGDGKLDVNTIGMFLRARYSLIKNH